MLYYWDYIGTTVGSIASFPAKKRGLGVEGADLPSHIKEFNHASQEGMILGYLARAFVALTC